MDFITFNSRDSYISTRFLSGGREVLSQAFRSGSLTPSSVMAEELEMEVLLMVDLLLVMLWIVKCSLKWAGRIAMTKVLA